MLIETKQIIPFTQLEKELEKSVQRVYEENESIYILKNDAMKAVLVPFQQYEYLSELEEIFERMEIAQTIRQRSETYTPSNNISWDSIKDTRSDSQKI